MKALRDVAVGDTIAVRQSPSSNSGAAYLYEAEVVKVGRVYLIVRRIGGVHATMRFDRITGKSKDHWPAARCWPDVDARTADLHREELAIKAMRHMGSARYLVGRLTTEELEQLLALLDAAATREA